MKDEEDRPFHPSSLIPQPLCPTAMPTAACRLLPYAVADGPHNMARDEVLLEAAVTGTASLRFYGWTEATVSLGYFQSDRLRYSDGRPARRPYRPRPTGAGT